MIAIHLLHPGFVHFTVAFLVGGALLEAAGILTRRPRLGAVGSTLVVFGTVFLVPTVVTGFLARNSVLVPAAAAETMDRHEAVGLALLAVFTLAIFWKAWSGGDLPERQRWAYVLLLLGCAALALFGAFLGGELVYAHGVGVRGS